MVDEAGDVNIVIDQAIRPATSVPDEDTDRGYD